MFWVLASLVALEANLIFVVRDLVQMTLPLYVVVIRLSIALLQVFTTAVVRSFSVTVSQNSKSKRVCKVPRISFKSIDLLVTSPSSISILCPWHIIYQSQQTAHKWIASLKHYEMPVSCTLGCHTHQLTAIPTPVTQILTFDITDKHHTVSQHVGCFWYVVSNFLVFSSSKFNFDEIQTLVFIGYVWICLYLLWEFVSIDSFTYLLILFVKRLFFPD